MNNYRFSPALPKRNRLVSWLASLDDLGIALVLMLGFAGLLLVLMGILELMLFSL